MITLIIACIYALLPTVISLFTAAACWVCVSIINGKLFTMSDGSGNLLGIFEEYFGTGGIGASLGIAADVIMALAVVITILLTLGSVITSYIDALSGDQSVPQLKNLARGIVTLILLFAIFGFPIEGKMFSTKGLLYECGSYFSKFIGLITTGWGGCLNSIKAINFSISLPAEQIAILVFNFALFKGVIEAGVVFIERWLSFALYVLFGPIAVACNASQKTKQSFGQWFFGILAQYITIFATVLGFRLFFNSMTNLEGIGTSGIGTNLVLNYAVALACLSFVKNSEKIVNALGFRTIANGDTAREFGRGVMEMNRQIIDPLKRPVQRAAAGRIMGQVTNSAYNSAQRHFGTNSPITQAAGIFRVGESNKKIEGACTVDENGKLKMPTMKDQTAIGKNRDTKFFGQVSYNRMNDSRKAVNDALEQGVGTAVSGKDVALATGLANRNDFKISEQAKIGEIDGKKAIMFSGSKVDLDGNESTSKQYAMVLDSNVLANGGKVVTNSDGDNVGFNINTRSEAQQFGNGTGYMYELSPQQSRNDYLQENLSAKEYGYVSTVQGIVNDYNQAKNVDGYDGTLQDFYTKYQNENANAELVSEKANGEYIFNKVSKTIDNYNSEVANKERVLAEFNTTNLDYAWKADANKKLSEGMFNTEESSENLQSDNPNDFFTPDDINSKL